LPKSNNGEKFYMDGNICPALAQTTKMSQEESRLLNLRELSTGK